jgi:mono/diheme cytochrome c family protein
VVRPVRETCEDNPLLAGCPYAGTGSGSPPPDQPVEIPDPMETPEESLDIAIARNVLLTNCGACHGSALTKDQASGGINYIDIWSELIRAGLIATCSDNSRIIRVMRRGDMPPPVSGLPAVPDVEIELVARAIDRECVD